MCSGSRALRATRRPTTSQCRPPADQRSTVTALQLSMWPSVGTASSATLRAATTTSWPTIPEVGFWQRNSMRRAADGPLREHWLQRCHSSDDDQIAGEQYSEIENLDIGRADRGGDRLRHSGTSLLPNPFTVKDSTGTTQ